MTYCQHITHITHAMEQALFQLFLEIMAQGGRAFGSPLRQSKERIQRHERWKVCATSANPIPRQMLEAENPKYVVFQGRPASFCFIGGPARDALLSTLSAAARGDTS